MDHRGVAVRRRCFCCLGRSAWPTGDRQLRLRQRGHGPFRATGDEFFYANGTWNAALKIPADRAYYGVWDELDDKQLADTRTILEEGMRKPGNKPGDFYASFMDEGAAEAKGARPLAPMLAAIDAASDRAALAAEHGRMERMGVSGLYII